MSKDRNLNFSHQEYGICSLEPGPPLTEIREYLAGLCPHDSVLNNCSIKSDFFHYLITAFGDEKRSNRLFIFKVNSSEHGLLGIAGFQRLVNNSGEIFLYLDKDPLCAAFQESIVEGLVEYAFSDGDCQTVIARSPLCLQISEKILANCGFIKKDGYYQTTIIDRRLFLLSNIIKKEAKNMLSNKERLAQEIGGRVSNLWYAYFSKGEVNLSGGGVEKSIVSLKDLIHSPSLEGFNTYQHEASPVISPERIRAFLLEEEVFRNAFMANHFEATFSLGAHEAFMRLSRCLFQPEQNVAMFFSMSCYGLFPTALAAMRPTSYDIVLLEIDRNRGEKIAIFQFKKSIKTNPTAKSLCLELKTMCGAVYDEAELAQIVLLCKENNIFLIADVTHSNMELESYDAYPDVLDICQKLDFHEVALIYTASKTYGLERARVGFILLDEKCNQIRIKDLEDDLVSVLGTVNDVSKHVAHFLMEIPFKKRRAFIYDLQRRHKFNLNLMIAYIEGIEGSSVDPELKNEIANEIPLQYQSGISGITMIYKPAGGIHMKIDVSGLQEFYFVNIRMFNSEMFCYVLNRIMGVVSLHAYCLADPKGSGIRLTFSRKNEVHKGMRLIHDFTKLLKKEPSENPFMPDILAEELIYNSNAFARSEDDSSQTREPYLIKGKKKSSDWTMVCS